MDLGGGNSEKNILKIYYEEYINGYIWTIKMGKIYITSTTFYRHKRSAVRAVKNFCEKHNIRVDSCKRKTSTKGCYS